MTTPPTNNDTARELRRLLTNLDLATAGRELGRIVGIKVAARLVGVTERRYSWDTYPPSASA